MNNLSVNEHHLKMQNKLSSIRDGLLNSSILKDFNPIFNEEKNEIWLNAFCPLNVFIKVAETGCHYGTENQKNKISICLYAKNRLIISSDTNLNISKPRLNKIINAVKENSEMWLEMAEIELKFEQFFASKRSLIKKENSKSSFNISFESKYGFPLKLNIFEYSFNKKLCDINIEAEFDTIDNAFALVKDVEPLSQEHCSNIFSYKIEKQRYSQSIFIDGSFDVDVLISFIEKYSL